MSKRLVPLFLLVLFFLPLFTPVLSAEETTAETAGETLADSASETAEATVAESYSEAIEETDSEAPTETASETSAPTAAESAESSMSDLRPQPFNIIRPPAETTTFTFYVDGEIYQDANNEWNNPQVLKEGEYLLEPKPPLMANKLFEGWYIGDEKIVFPYQVGHFESEVIVEAKFIDAVQVTFWQFLDGQNKILRVKPIESGKQVDATGVPMISEAGSIFSHWTKTDKFEKPSEDDAKNPFDFNQAITENTFLLAVMKPGYLVTFQSHGGTVIDQVRVGSDELISDKVPKDDQMKRMGYDFSHWSLEENGVPYNLNQSPKEDLTLHAVWKNGSSKYRVVYYGELADSDEYERLFALDRDAGTGSILEENMLRAAISNDFDNSEYSSLKDEYIYDHISFFSTDKDGNGNDLVRGDQTSIVRIYLQRKRYTITFKSSDGKTDYFSTSLKWNQATNEAFSKASEISRKPFWTKNINSYRDVYSSPPKMERNDMTLYQSKINATGQYTYTFYYREDGDEDTDILKPFSFNYSNSRVTVTENDYITIDGFKRRDTPKKENFTSDGPNRYKHTFYYIRLDFPIVVYARNDAYPPIQELARFFYDLPIDDERNKGNNPNDNQYELAKSYFENFKENISQRESDNFIFKGWATEADGQVVYKSFEDIKNYKMGLNALVLYGVWEPPTHKITVYRTNQLSAKSQIITVNHRATMDENLAEELKSNTGEKYADRPDAEGAEFLGWYYYGKDDQLMPFDYKAIIDRDYELYPLWTVSNVRVHVDMNGGTANQVDIEKITVNIYAYGSAFTIPILRNIKGPEGNPTFLGWKIVKENNEEEDELDVNKIYYTSHIIPMLQNITLVAQWGPANMPTNLQYLANDGSEREMVLAADNNSILAVIENPFPRPGYKFLSWNTQADGQGETYLVGETFLIDRVNEDSSNRLYAIWEELPVPEPEPTTTPENLNPPFPPVAQYPQTEDVYRPVENSPLSSSPSQAPTGGILRPAVPVTGEKRVALSTSLLFLGLAATLLLFRGRKH